MNQMTELARRVLKMPSFYLGTLFLALSNIGMEMFRRDRMSLSGAAYGLLGLLAMATATIFATTIVLRLRESFTTNRPNAVELTLSLTWYSVKLFFCIIATFIPLIIFSALFYRMAITNAPLFMAILFAAIIALVILWMAPMFGSVALLIARGHSGRCLIDSLSAFSWVWKEGLQVLLLQLAPLIITMPAAMVASSLGMPLITAGINICFAPYQFMLWCVGYTYLAKLLVERNPALVAKGS